jgi:hypothetical protein
LEDDASKDGLKLICHKNLNRSRYFGEIDFFGNTGSDRNLAENSEIA